MSIYFPKLQSDTNAFSLVLYNNGNLIDTLQVRTTSKNYKNPISFFNDSIANKNPIVIETQSFKLVSSYYSLSTIYTAKILLTDTAQKNIPFTIHRSDDLQTYFIKADWKDAMQYKLQFQDSVLSDLVGNYNKNIFPFAHSFDN